VEGSAFVDMVIGVVIDLYFGLEVCFEGKLRKFSYWVGALFEVFVVCMNREVWFLLVVNFGDDIEDELLEVDRARYGEVMQILVGLEVLVLYVVGNHDIVHLGARDLFIVWGVSDSVGCASSLRVYDEPKLYDSFEHNGLHVIMLHTRERKNVDVHIDEEQLA
jgi:hypothetical protein